MVSAIPAQTWTGSAIEPEVTVKDGDTPLTKDTNYTVAYSNNTDVGTNTATATITGLYNSSAASYYGSVEKIFSIVKADMPDLDGINKNDSGVYGPVTVTIGEDKPTTYGITVGNGTADKETAAAGETVTIKAASAPTSQVFDKWMSEDGVTFADAQAEETTFVMPGKAVTVTATYKNKSSQFKSDDNIQSADDARQANNTQQTDNTQPQQTDNTSALDNNTQSKTEVTENNDGSTTKTTTEIKANGDFTQTVVTTGADGRISETVTSKETDVQTGTVKETRTEKSADGSTEETVRTTQTNGDITESTTVKAVDGSSAESVKTVSASGNVTETMTVKDADGSSEETKRVTGADGSFTRTSTNTNSAGVVTETRTDTHEVAANGSASETSTIISSGTTTEQKLTIGESGQVTSAELTVTNTNGKETAVSLTAGTNGLVLKDVDSDTKLTLNGSNIRLGKDCLKGTSEKLVIIVRSNKEKRNIRSQLAKAGNPNATVIVEK